MQDVYILKEKMLQIPSGTKFIPDAENEQFYVAETDRSFKLERALVEKNTMYFYKKESQEYEKGFRDGRLSAQRDSKVKYNTGYNAGLQRGFRQGYETSGRELTEKEKKKFRLGVQRTDFDRDDDNAITSSQEYNNPNNSENPRI